MFQDSSNIESASRFRRTKKPHRMHITGSQASYRQAKMQMLAIANGRLGPPDLVQSFIFVYPIPLSQTFSFFISFLLHTSRLFTLLCPLFPPTLFCSAPVQYCAGHMYTLILIPNRCLIPLCAYPRFFPSLSLVASTLCIITPYLPFVC